MGPHLARPKTCGFSLAAACCSAELSRKRGAHTPKVRQFQFQLLCRLFFALGPKGLGAPLEVAHKVSSEQRPSLGLLLCEVCALQTNSLH